MRTALPIPVCQEHAIQFLLINSVRKTERRTCNSFLLFSRMREIEISITFLQLQSHLFYTILFALAGVLLHAVKLFLNQRFIAFFFFFFFIPMLIRCELGFVNTSSDLRDGIKGSIRSRISRGARQKLPSTVAGAEWSRRIKTTSH